MRRTPRRDGLLRWLAALFCVLIASQCLAEATLPDLRTVQRETRKLAQLQREIAEAAARIESRVGELQQRVADEERLITGVPVDVAALRGARLDLETIQSRLAVVHGRIEQHELALARLRGRIDELARHLAAVAAPTLEDLRLEAGLRLLREQETETLAVLATFRRLAETGRRKREILAQRLRLLQSRLQLAAIDRAAADTSDERIPVLEAVISDFMLRATRAGRDLESVVGNTASAQTRRRTLEGRVNDAVTRGFLRQNDLELVLAENRLDSFATLRSDSSMPRHVLRAATRKLGEIGATLDRIEAALATQRAGLQSRRSVRFNQGSENEAETRAAEDLEDLMDFQREDIAKLRERLRAEQTEFARVIGEAGAASLSEHRALPTAKADWRRIGRAALDLPLIAAATGSQLSHTLGSAVAATSRRNLLLFAIGSVSIAVAMLWGVRRLSRFAHAQHEPGTLALAARAAARGLPWALPAALWLLGGLLIGLQHDLLVPLLVLLALWPTAIVLLHLSTGVLGGSRSSADQGAPAQAGEPASDGTPDPVPDGSRRRLLRHLRIGVVLATAVATVHILTELMALPPLLADVLDRLGMLAFLALLNPAFGIARALRERVGASPQRASRALRFISRLARLLPGFVLVTGVAGVLGFTNLAWTLIDYALSLLLIAIGLFVGAGMLEELARRINARLQARDPAGAEFWRSHFVDPGTRVAELALALAAGHLLLRLWGWDAQTPMVRWATGLVDTELFEVAGAPFTAGDVLLSLVLIGAVFWIGGWSHQVSYRLAYRRIRDQGLRQALATFTRYLVVVAGLLLALSAIGFDLTALTVFAASLGVGIGFGLQNMVNNFLSGILLLAERPLRIGDYVSIAPHEGTVTHIGMRSLTVRTPDRQEVVIPNGSVISKDFTNWTRSDDTVRQVHYFVIRYDSDRERAIALIREVLAANPNVLSEPAPGIYLWEYTDEGVRIRVQFCFRFVHGPGGFATRSEVLMEIGRRFVENGIAFADIGALRRLALEARAEPV